MTHTSTPGVDEAATAVAATVWRQFRRYVDKQDLIQEAREWTYKRREYINEMLAVEDEEERKHNEKKIWWQLRRVCERYARKEKAQKGGYHTSDESFYDITTISQLLPHILASIIDGTILEEAQQLIDDGTPRKKSNPSEGRNLLVMLIDIKVAYESLENKDQSILKARYFDNNTLSQISQHLECSISTADRRCANALRLLQRKLGGESCW
jgi:RNA polymerase sigma factor (sigma-70 family)